MIDLDKLSALEKAAKRGPWYAWLKPVHTPDKCITTVPAEQFLREYKEAEKFNAELSERIGHAAVSDEWKNRYLTYDEEVIGCSEWLHAENADLLLIVEMRNQLPDLIAYIDRLVAEIERLRSAIRTYREREESAFSEIEMKDEFLMRQNARIKELEARLGHEQVVTMQDRETQLQKHIQELEKKVEFWSGVAMKYAPDEEVMEG